MPPGAVIGTRAVIKIVGKFARGIGTMCRRRIGRIGRGR